MRALDYDPIVGMLVTCVDDTWEHSLADTPKKGGIYRIAAVASDVLVRNAIYQGTYIGLVECAGLWGHRPEFNATCFKPVDPKRIEVFRAHLTKAPGPWVREGVDA